MPVIPYFHEPQKMNRNAYGSDCIKWERSRKRSRRFYEPRLGRKRSEWDIFVLG